MNKSYFIITGTSKGIGEQLAKMLLENGDFVCGIARGKSSILDKYENYSHIQFDLSDTSSVEHMMSEAIYRIDIKDVEMICLINNAAMLEPLKSIDQCTTEEINKNLQISLIAPMILTSCFIKQTNTFQRRRKIINISSGSGSYPAPEMSVYCTAKAGINMFTQCVGAEQSTQNSPVEIISVDPGMVDTELQVIAREKNDQEFKLAKNFKQAQQTGQLQTKENICNHLINIIDKRFDSGKLVSFLEG
ncbi:SDR family NAD(P)-dependent oxidoreductase [Paenibacillus crassostreae]|uniref:Short-chain dehydrogenase n=1 Tax=Paenibacillus crassostreae TaxID=1763538 RepID=A0A167BW40_9BACL|nr:SDR family NAD(P)-dependent oxidoreductase [Paenibacillus crassostreae]OAB72509.1 short-chain dehydrogenase [Paenibacillus crassostreae]